MGFGLQAQANTDRKSKCVSDRKWSRRDLHLFLHSIYLCHSIPDFSSIGGDLETIQALLQSHTTLLSVNRTEFKLIINYKY